MMLYRYYDQALQYDPYGLVVGGAHMGCMYELLKIKDEKMLMRTDLI